jgi:hypothetical protein
MYVVSKEMVEGTFMSMLRYLSIHHSNKVSKRNTVLEAHKRASPTAIVHYSTAPVTPVYFDSENIQVGYGNIFSKCPDDSMVAWTAAAHTQI